MPPKLLVDLSEFDLDKIAIGMEDVRRIVPQRYEMEQLSGIIACDVARSLAIGVREVRGDEFWVLGHIPGRPLMPGVLMLEAAAQLCTFYYKKARPDDDRFLGFGGINNVKFRGTVAPGDRLILIAVNTELKTRRACFETQGVVDGRHVFEAQIIGMPV